MALIPDILDLVAVKSGWAFFLADQSFPENHLKIPIFLAFEREKEREKERERERQRQRQRERETERERQRDRDRGTGKREIIWCIITGKCYCFPIHYCSSSQSAAVPQPCTNLLMSGNIMS